MELKSTKQFDELFCKTLEMLQREGFDFFVFEYPRNTFRDFAVLGFSHSFVNITWRNAFNVASFRIEVDPGSKSLLQSLHRFYATLKLLSDELKSDSGLFGFCNQSCFVGANMEGTQTETHAIVRNLVSNFLEIRMPNNRPPLLFGNRIETSSGETLIVDLELPISLRLKLHRCGIRATKDLGGVTDSMLSLTNSEKTMLQQALTAN